MHEHAGCNVGASLEKRRQGRENVRAYLKENKDTTAKIEAEVRRAVGLTPDVPEAKTGTDGAGVGGGARVTQMPNATEGKVPAARR